jgi:hypothetical protein
MVKMLPIYSFNIVVIIIIFFINNILHGKKISRVSGLHFNSKMKIYNIYFFLIIIFQLKVNWLRLKQVVPRSLSSLWCFSFHFCLHTQNGNRKMCDWMKLIQFSIFSIRILNWTFAQFCYKLPTTPTPHSFLIFIYPIKCARYLYNI